MSQDVNLGAMLYITQMDSLQTRLVFALSVLGRDDDAQQILGDLLESDGELGMANWARARKKSWQKRLDFVIGILPHRLTLQITADFLVHILSLLNEQPRQSMHVSRRANERDIGPLIRQIHTIGRWTRDQATAVELEEAIRSLNWIDHWAYGILNINSTMQTLHMAVSLAKQVAENPQLNCQASTDSIRNACRKVIRRSREMLRPVGHSFLRPRTQASIDTGLPHPLADWQFKHTIKIIEDALEGYD